MKKGKKAFRYRKGGDWLPGKPTMCPAGWTGSQPPPSEGSRDWRLSIITNG